MNAADHEALAPVLEASNAQPQPVATDEAGPATARPEPATARPEPATARPEPDGAPEPAGNPTGPDPVPQPDDPESVFVPLRTAEELYGYTFHGTVDAHGPTAIGNSNFVAGVYNYNAATQDAAAFVTHLPLAGLQDYYASTPVDQILDEILKRQHVACLTGPPGTGRFTTACAALARHHPGQVHEVHLPAELDLGTLCTQPEHLVRGGGHVLRVPGVITSHTIRMLDGVFRRRDATAVLIRDLDQRDAEMPVGAVAHRPAAPTEVFSQHVRHAWRPEYPDRSEQYDQVSVDRYLDLCLSRADLCTALTEAYRPREIVDIAEAVAARKPQGDEEFTALLAASQPVRRRRAAEILLPEREGDTPRYHRVGQYERAFRIAYAVFSRKPLHHVFDSAGLFLDQIDEEELPGHRLGRHALVHPVSELLGGTLARDWQDAQLAEPGTSRTVRLRDAKMRGAILDIAWHEFDNTRPAMLRWLRQLVEDGDETDRRAAADVAGLLAHYDFDYVYTALVDRWAGSAFGAQRDAAARVAVTAARGGQVTHRVRGKVRAWVWSKHAYRRDTAARVYASGLHQPYLLWTLADLHRIADDPMQRHQSTVANAIDRLYVSDLAGPLITELRHWTDGSRNSPGTQASAAHAFLSMAVRVNTVDATGRLDLLDQVAKGQVNIPDLAALWKVALLEPGSDSGAWEILYSWLCQPEIFPELQAVLAELFACLAEDNVLRRRLSFYRDRRWHHHQPLIDAATGAVRHDT